MNTNLFLSPLHINLPHMPPLHLVCSLDADRDMRACLLLPRLLQRRSMLQALLCTLTTTINQMMMRTRDLTAASDERERRAMRSRCIW